MANAKQSLSQEHTLYQLFRDIMVGKYEVYCQNNGYSFEELKCVLIRAATFVL